MQKEVKNQILGFISKCLDDINVCDDEPIKVNNHDRMISVQINPDEDEIIFKTFYSNGTLRYFNAKNLLVDLFTLNH